MSKTRIICTMGPASDTTEIIEKMIDSGMNVARFNFSHGTHEQQRERYERIDEIRKRKNVPLAMLMDTKGPEVRFRDFEGGSVELSDGDHFVLTTKELLGTKDKATISYKNLYKDVKPGTTILVNDGIIELVVEAIEEVSEEENNILCKVVHGGRVSNHKAVNVPEVHLSMDYLSEVDKSDLTFAAEMGYEFIAASFVSEAQNIIDVRNHLAQYDYYPKIIAKIENQDGVDHLEEILAVSDGIMVARGDMGVEIAFEKLPDIQKEMIANTIEAGKIVITATNMLESMCENPRPTRAEVNDVANAIYDGSTAVMLSGESAAGKYPVEAVTTMEKVAREVENSPRCQLYYPKENSSAQLIANSSVEIAENLNAKAIIALTLSGSTAHRISLNRPAVKLIACCPTSRVANTLNLSYGVESEMIQICSDEEELIAHAIGACKKSGRIQKGDTVVVVAGLPLEQPGNTNTIRIVTVE